MRYSPWARGVVWCRLHSSIIISGVLTYLLI